MREKKQFVTMHYVDDAYHRAHPQMMHRHNDVLELLYILEGGGTYLVGGHAYYVQPGNLVICNAGIFHGEPSGQSKNMVSVCCVLNHVTQPGLARNTLIAREDHPVLYFAEDQKEIETVFLTLLRFSRKGGEYAAVCERLAQAVLEMVQLRLQKRNQMNDQTRQNNSELIRMVSDYLDEHFKDNPSLEELEQYFHISRFALSHVFKEETGLAPMKYVMLRRIGEAQSLLMNSGMAIGEIGGQLGFNDNSHFSNTFKKYTGTTPAAYRRHFRESETDTQHLPEE